MEAGRPAGAAEAGAKEAARRRPDGSNTRESKVPVDCPHCKSRISDGSKTGESGNVCPSCGMSVIPATNATEAWVSGQPERKLGRFEILEKIGSGAYGLVYKARDPELRRVVAIKTPLLGQLTTGEDVERFLRESRSLAQLQHPGIVPVYEIGQADGLPFLVSEFVSGMPLSDYLTGRRIPFREASELVAQVAEALEYAHEQGVVHRDVKPGNLMLHFEGDRRKPGGSSDSMPAPFGHEDGSTRSGSRSTRPRSASHSGRSSARSSSVILTYRPRLMDFGLARREGAADATLTQAGDVLGTPTYMSPEQAAGESHKVDGRTDVYSLGIVLYELLTGELPFRGNKRMLLHQVLNDEPRPPRRLNDRVPRDLETICLKCMQKSPSRRYETAGELAFDLRRWQNNEPIQARPAGWVEVLWRRCRRNPTVAGLTAAVVVLLLAGTGISTSFGIRATAQKIRADAKATEAQDNARIASEQATRADQKAAEAETSAKLAREEAQRADRKTEEALQYAREAHANLYVVRINTVQLACEQGNMALARDLLEITRKPPEGQADLRGWEWNYYWRQANDAVAVLGSHGERVDSVNFSPDGRRIVAGTGEALIVWDAATGQELWKTEALNWLDGVAISPDGHLLATADETPRLFDLATGQLVRDLVGHTAEVLAVAYSPDGSQLATAGEDFTIKLWEPATGQVIRTMTGHTDSVRVVAFSPDGLRLASGSRDQTVRLWDVADGRQTALLSGHLAQINGVAFNPDGNLLATSSDDRTVRVSDLGGAAPPVIFREHIDFPRGVCFSPDGQELASAGSDDVIRIWNPRTGEPHRVLRGHTRGLYEVNYSPDGQRLVSGGTDATVRVWDSGSGRASRTLTGHTNQVRAVGFGDEGRLVVSVGLDGAIRVWDAMTGQPRNFPTPLRSMLGLAVSSDGLKLATAFDDGSVAVWDLLDGRMVWRAVGHESWLSAVAFSPDGRRVVSGGRDKMIRLWDAADGRDLGTFKGCGGEVKSLVFSPDGNTLYSTSDEATLRAWNVATQEEIRKLDDPDQAILSLAMSRDGRLLATGGDEDRTIKIWNAADFSFVRALRGHSDVVFSVDFSPDGARLASGSWDRTVRIWDVATGYELAVLKGHGDRVLNVAFSPEGRLASAGGADLTVQLWDGRSWTETSAVEREAEALLEYLFALPLSLADVQDYVREVAAIRPEVRDQAIVLSARFRDEQNPQRYHEAAWQTLRRQYLKPVLYRLALLQARTAFRLAPENPAFLSPIGVAQYRLGQFEDAAATLLRSASLNPNLPADLAFLALSQRRLNQSEAAHATLEQLQELMGKEPWSQDAKARSYLREAETAIEPAELMTGP